MITLRSLLTVSCILTLLACSPEINNSTLAGKWETKNLVVEIFQDGKIVFGSANRGNNGVVSKISRHLNF